MLKTEWSLGEHGTRTREGHFCCLENRGCHYLNEDCPGPWAPCPPPHPPSHYPSWVYFIALIAVWNYLGYSLFSYSLSTSLECKLHESSGFICLIRPLDCQGLQQCLARQVPHKCEWMNQRWRQSQITCVLGEGTHCPFWTILLAKTNHMPAKPNTNRMEGTCCL